MRNFFSALILGCGLALGIQPAAQARDAEAEAAAQRLGETFARGFYVRDSEMVTGVVHPALSKLGVWPNIRNSGRDGILSLPPGTLDIFAQAHNADGHIDPATAVTQVSVLDTSRDVAVFRLIAVRDWFDYHLAARIGDEWVIVNCVFGGLPDLEAPVTDQDRAAVSQAASAYANAVADDDFSALSQAVHLDFTRRHVRARPPQRLIVETLETLEQDMRGRRGARPDSIEVLAVSRVAAAVRVDRRRGSEWVFLLKLDGAWRPVNSFVDAD
jgi:hypothetical protein